MLSPCYRAFFLHKIYVWRRKSTFYYIFCADILIASVSTILPPLGSRCRPPGAHPAAWAVVPSPAVHGGHGGHGGSRGSYAPGSLRQNATRAMAAVNGHCVLSPLTAASPGGDRTAGTQGQLLGRPWSAAQIGQNGRTERTKCPI